MRPVALARVIKASFCFLIVAMVPHESSAQVGAEEIGQRCVDALKEMAAWVHFKTVLPVQDKRSKQDLVILMGDVAGAGGADVAVLLRMPGACRLVLDAEGRDIRPDPNSQTAYPNLRLTSGGYRDEDGVIITEEELYIWTGVRYQACDDRPARAKGPVCRLEEIRAADARLNWAYQKLLGRRDAYSAQLLRGEQRGWLQARDRACPVRQKPQDKETWLHTVASDQKTATCILRMTEGRLRALEDQE